MLIWLIAVWVTLWESLSWANLAGGVLVAVGVTWLLPPGETGHHVGVRPLAAIRLLLYFLWELVEASGLIAWEVVTPRSRINAAVVSVELETDVAGIVTSVANMVSLTPGTVTLEIDEENSTLFIHVLHFKSLEDTRASVRRLEELAVAAFPLRPEDRLTVNPGEDRV
ncbi:MAG TPA: Na+/H+ antiporter subunit E [Acidimicrobiia bacterium]|nr:Na+/H+ antiporter subunit E [Acidimicrobiia bacterium]